MPTDPTRTPVRTLALVKRPGPRQQPGVDAYDHPLARLSRPDRGTLASTHPGWDRQPLLTADWVGHGPWSSSDAVTGNRGGIDKALRRWTRANDVVRVATYDGKERDAEHAAQRQQHRASIELVDAREPPGEVPRRGLRAWLRGRRGRPATPGAPDRAAGGAS